MSLDRNGTTTFDHSSAPAQAASDAPARQRRYIDLKTAADMMSISEATTRRLVDSGKIPVIRIPSVMGRKPEQKKTNRSKDILRMDVKDIDNFMRKHKELC